MSFFLEEESSHPFLYKQVLFCDPFQPLLFNNIQQLANINRWVLIYIL